MILVTDTTHPHASGTICLSSTIVCQKKTQLAREAEEIRQEKKSSKKALKKCCETEGKTAVRQNKDRVTQKKRYQAMTQEKKIKVSASRRLVRNAKFSANCSKTVKIASRNFEAKNDDGIIESDSFCCRRGNVVSPQWC